MTIDKAVGSTPVDIGPYRALLEEIPAASRAFVERLLREAGAGTADMRTVTVHEVLARDPAKWAER